MSARILVVDDMLPNVKLLEAKLSREYYEVITAQDGYGAIEQAKKFSPDIILLDVMMPGMDGFETCKKLRADPALAHIPVVMVTALSEKEDRIHGLQAGADDFLTKPVNDISLFARVRSLIRLKIMMDELRLRGSTGTDLGLDGNDSNIGNIGDAKIMIVDDDAVQAAQLVNKLSSINKNIKLVSQPELAVEEATKNEYDLILVSTQLTNADGLRICSQLRSNERTRNVSILIMIDEDDTNELVKGLELGVNDYIITPIDANELVARTRTQVRRKKYQDALRSNYKTSLSLAITDSLTGLYNRRYMDTHVDNMVKESIDVKRPLAVLMLDIDHFKQINDTYGHQAGDEVIKEFAQRILKNIRPSDLAVRYGGEEFVVLLPFTDNESAKVVAERIRTSVMEPSFELGNGKSERRTVSIGIAGLKLDGDNAHDLIGRADVAVFKAKNSGRNRTEMA